MQYGTQNKSPRQGFSPEIADAIHTVRAVHTATLQEGGAAQ